MPRMNREEMKKKYNNILESSNQNLRIDVWSSEILLNNGMVLTGRSTISQFKNRIKNWHNHFDLLYSVDSSIREQTLKKLIKDKNRKAGLKTFEIHGKRMVKNLNIGTPWNKGMKNYPYKPIHTGMTKENSEVARKISKSKSGSLNPNFGKTMSEPTRRKKSLAMRELIASGSFTPNIRNSRTHWQVEYNGQRYRSSWEAAFHYLNPNYEYETIRIDYSINDRQRIYIVDFVDHQNKILVEIKPSSHRNNCTEKFSAAKKWCDERHYKFQIISEEYFKTKSDELKDSDLSQDIKIRLPR